PGYFISVIEDISERKKAEEERDLLLVREQLARAEAVTARRRLALLAAAGPALSASLDYEETMEGITRLLVPELADWCLLDMVEEDGDVNQLAAAHADPEKEDLLRRLREHRQFEEEDPESTAEVLRTGKSVMLPDLPDDYYEQALEGEHLEIMSQLEPRSLMCVPLLARGKTLGAITLVSSRLDRRYDEEDLLLVENLAYRCALAADNARLYRDRSEIARVLQRSLLPPHLPEVPGVEVGAEYLPVGETNDVGGDFYDLINTVEDGWICAIGDVRGKGVEAAAVTALARYTIRAVTLKDDRPSEILAALNEAMLRQLPEDRFCSAACVRLEPQDGSPGVGVDVSRAGHPPPLVLHADGTVEEVGCPGKVLGVFADAELGDTSLRLMPGEALVLYTDGVTEARSSDGGFFGEDRLHHLLRSYSGCDAETIARRIKSVVLEFQEGYPRDDLAVLVLRVSD
ncbi:MAG TPA: SpoIIE family protein phosphatase, partial [Rubrobacter sp.]|nr:SpoIIE family protein phosphatase [Rubrobacter sp.]